MKKPTQTDFDTCRTVLEFMLVHTTEHEPWAVQALDATEAALDQNSFDVNDYE